jgi:hypothetical protein
LGAVFVGTYGVAADAMGFVVFVGHGFHPIVSRTAFVPLAVVNRLSMWSQIIPLGFRPSSSQRSQFSIVCHGLFCFCGGPARALFALAAPAGEWSPW